MARILVVDDERDTRTAIRRILEDVGHEIVEATNGVEGTRTYAETPFDLIITDILMPEKDGVEALLELRADFPDIRALVISGEGAEFLPVAEEFGALRTLPKPFLRNDLIRVVEEILTQNP